MDEEKKDRKEESCARCRWVELKPQPYGAVDYLCARRQEPLSSALLAKRRCAEFEP
ncbi:MAG: hypothetical protein PHS14_08855 [Elusimicrobia bacterium]|nr:hypothetical protein [Elusimicrobiota bacterium]